MVSGLAVQLLNGLAGASSLFLVAAGLSLIFGVTRIVNFAHGSFYMLGPVRRLHAGRARSAPACSASGARCCSPRSRSRCSARWSSSLLLRRIYHAPELFQLLATFALVLIISDAALWLWGPEDLLGPRAPGLKGAVQILGRAFSHLRPVPDRRRPGRARPALAAAAAHALGHAGARGDPGPRDGRRARRQPGLAVHRRVRARLGARRRSAARCSCRASRPTCALDLHNDRRRLRRGRGRRHGQHPGRLPRRADHRRDQGDLHRHRHGRRCSALRSRSPSSRWWSSSWSWRSC